MNPRASDDASVSSLPTPNHPPRQLRRAPAGTPLATPIVSIPLVADGTAPAPRVAAPRLGLRAVLVALPLIAIALAVTYAMYTRAARREALEAQYPIVADATDAQTIEREAARWSAGAPRLLRALAAFDAPPLASLVGAGACPFDGQGVALTTGPDLVREARAQIDAAIAAAERGRFASIAARTELLDQLTGPVVVAAGDVVYGFDPGSGELRCAGTHILRAVQ